MSNPLQKLLDVQAFRDEGHKIIDMLADYLQNVEQVPVLPKHQPEKTFQEWAEKLQHQSPSLTEDLQEMLQQSIHLHSPRYIGHQNAPTAPTAALTQMVVSLLDQSTAIFEMAPVGVACERATLRLLADALGFDAKADGTFTSGGSLGMLTALLAARQVKAGYNVWQNGVYEQPLAIMVSEQAHYCIARVAQIMGLGEQGVIKVPVDENFRIKPEALETCLQQARGRKVIAVVASACNTGAGAYDPIEAIADFCEKHNLWLHVDGAHGASVALSPRYRHLIKGIERADSVVWDAHKMLMMPSLATAVIYRNGAHAQQAFQQDPAYLPKGADINFYTKAFECTKPQLAMPLYMALRYAGKQALIENIDITYDLARTFASLLHEAKDFELACEPQANIVCFRYIGTQTQDLNALQLKVREHILNSEQFYIVQTTLNNKIYLRTTLMNPRTTIKELELLMQQIRSTTF